MTIEFHRVVTPEDQQQLADLANVIWHEYWPAIIGQDQTDYMVRNFQTLEAIQRDMEHNGYEYWLLLDSEQNAIGYTGGHDEAETRRFFISKIYLTENARGHGYCRKTVEFYAALCKERGLEALYLTVNKHNDIAIRAYHGLGFRTIDAVETDIGEGFVMDDYIMQKDLI